MTLTELVDACAKLNVKLAVDGDQLRVQAPAGAVSLELRAALKEHKATLIARLAKPGIKHTTASATLPPVEAFPLSHAQHGLWLLHQADPASFPAYNVRAARRFRGALDTHRLEIAVQRLIRRHDPLRTVFISVDGVPAQRVLEHVDFALQIEDLSGLPDEQREFYWRNALDREGQRVFDLGMPPLFALRLFRLGGDEHVMVLNAPHLIADGLSAGLLLREIAEVYAGSAVDHPVSFRYSDYVRDQQAGEQLLDSHLAFWKERLAGVPSLQLPADFAYPRVAGYRGASVHFEIPPDLDAAVRSFGRREGFTLFQTLLAGFAALLHRLSGQTDFGIGYALAGRDRLETENLLGYFVNLVVLRAQVSEQLTFRDLLRQTRERATEAFQHQEAPFYRIVRELHASGDTGRNPLFQVLFLYQQSARGSAQFSELATSVLNVPSVTSKYELSLHVDDHGDGLSALIEYNTALFRETTVQAISKRLVQLLTAAVAAPGTPLLKLDILAENERNKLLHTFNSTAHQVPETTLNRLFERQVERTPDAVALRFEGESLTYRELNGRANSLAHHLIARGVGPEALVGICLERSFEMVVSLLGVHKAGAAYVPLDPEYPRARLAYMVADSSPVLAITAEALRACLPDSLPLLLFTDIEGGHTDDPAETEQKTPLLPEHPAYVIYTSGSTGTPKGAPNTHQALVNRILWMQASYRLDATDAVLQKTPYSFDVSGWEFFWPLLTGACLEIAAPGQHRDVDYLIRTIVAQQITTIHFVPSMLRAFLDEPGSSACRGLRRVICSGEALPGDLQKLFFDRLPNVELHNLYGPTEAAIDVTFWRCLPGDEAPPIGAPIWNTRTYVLDRALEPVPAGVAGELYLAGMGLARGYLNRPGLTSERFIADPHGEPGTRMYRTGDLARWRQDGNIEYLGRIDQQVKIRGFRIELGEIESALQDQPGVLQAAVTVRESGPSGKQLVAYAVPAPDQKVDVPALRHALDIRLPGYMVPSAFVVLTSLPLTSSGKLDRRALPEPQRELESYRQPRTRGEQILCGLFAELLSLPQVGIDDNFFRLGGDSISSILLVSRFAKAGFQISPQDVFQHPTAAALAALAKAPDFSTSSQEKDEGEIAPTPIMRWFLEGAGLDHRFSQSVLIRVPAELRQTELIDGLDAVTDAHGALRSRLEKRSEGWIFGVGPLGQKLAAARLRRVDAGGFTEVELRNAEGHLDPLAGKMWEAVWFPSAGRLLLVVHHFAIDGVSWRILVPDLSAACAGAKLAERGLPFISWARHLVSRAHLPSILSELKTWEAITTDCPTLDLGAGGSASRSLSIGLPVRETAALVQSVTSAFHARVDDVLLAALAVAVGEPVLVDLEGHGREPGDDGIDVSRTVGWFTTLFPVRLTVEGHDLAANIKRVKELLRAVPGKGLSYGLLRYLNAETAPALAVRPKAQIAFNYLGRVPAGSSRDWELAADSFSAITPNPSVPLGHPIAISAMVIDGPDGPALHAVWNWSGGLHSEQTVGRLADRFTRALRDMVELVARGGGGYTPSDFPLVALSQPQVDGLQAACPRLEQVIPLSPLQEGLLFHSLYDERAHDIYTLQVAISLEGVLDRTRLKAAADAMLRRHENLRVSIRHEGLDKPVQVVPHDVMLPWREVESTGDADAMLAAERRGRFDLLAGPLLRFAVIREAPDRHIVALTAHHILMDGWSLPVFFEEFLALYKQGADSNALPPVKPYAAYAKWLLGHDHVKARTAWREYLAELADPTRLSPPPKAGTAALPPERLEFNLPVQLTARLQEFCRSRGLTLSTSLHGIWAILLGRLSGKSDVVFGVTVSGRPAELVGVERMVGLFINTLPMRVELKPGESLPAFFERIQVGQSRMLAYQQVSLADIQRDAAAGDLFDTLLVFENYPLDKAAFPSLDGVRITNVASHDATHYPLTLVVLPGDRIHLRLDFDATRLERSAVERIGRSFVEMAEAIVAEPASRVQDIDILDQAERRHLLDGVNGISPVLPLDTLTERFELQAAKTPEAVAVTCEGQTVTYGELNGRANRLAHHLISLGVGPESLVAIRLERGISMLVSALGILKAGGAYLPLDPEYPEARIQGMLADAQPVCTITSEWPELCHSALAGAAEHNPSQHERQSPLYPDHPAYVIYTSGSTGTPKGVVVTHQNVIRLFDATMPWFAFGSQDVWTLFHSFAFDFSVWEIWGPLLHGGRLVIVPKMLSRSPEEFLNLLMDEGVTVLNQTPSAFYQLIQAGTRNALVKERLALRYIIFGGEALDPGRLEEWYCLQPKDGATLVNMYGITETTVHVTYQPLDRELARTAGASLIGRNIPDLRLYVLDNRLEPVPAGVTGEMFVAGSGLARGYLKRPSLTADRFIADPHGPAGSRMYRTGDRARRRIDGSLEYLGRIDQQVKIRGFRIELGEIDSALAAQAGVSAAASVVRNGALVAYVAPTPGASLDPATLRRGVSERLPDYMVPTAIVVLAELPLTVHGKLNRAALPEPGKPASHSIVKPRDEEEKTLAAIWAEVLGCGEVGVTDDFFALGGQSLLATQVMTRLRERCGVNLPLRVIFEQPTVEALAHAVRTAAQTEAPATRSAGPRRTARSRRQVNLNAVGEIDMEVPLGTGD